VTGSGAFSNPLFRFAQHRQKNLKLSPFSFFPLLFPPPLFFLSLSGPFEKSLKSPKPRFFQSLNSVFGDRIYPQPSHLPPRPETTSPPPFSTQSNSDEVLVCSIPPFRSPFGFPCLFSRKGRFLKRRPWDSAHGFSSPPPLSLFFPTLFRGF